ncbi:hypothetical protein BB561_002802 [Smittium simulii]|uniref:G patch domain-containing protein n=1 Tax=Smittium simulii TaxID=133385 RepID=A0A2T9YP24_9FUNG|nr:hypothetical protein BB561_002802 [Smittium simulii]
MNAKRSRPNQSAFSDDSDDDYFVLYGLGFDSEANKNSHKPTHKQIAVDENGSKRFHGAFTGGFSAGYNNTVGSKEGWAPTTFVSSRSNRAKYSSQKIEDFMDTEDHIEMNSSKKIVPINQIDTLSISYQLKQNSRYSKTKDENALNLKDNSSFEKMLLETLGFTFKNYCDDFENLADSDFWVTNNNCLGYNNETFKKIGYNNLEAIFNNFSSGNSTIKDPKTENISEISKSEDPNPTKLKKKLKKNSAKIKISKLKDAVILTKDHFLSTAAINIKNNSISIEKLYSITPDKYIQKLYCLDGKPSLDGFIIIENITNNNIMFSECVLNASNDQSVPKDFNKKHNWDSLAINGSSLVNNMPGFQPSSNNNNTNFSIYDSSKACDSTPSLNNSDQNNQVSDISSILSGLTKDDAQNALKGFIPFSSSVTKQELYKKFLNHIIENKPMDNLHDQLGCPKTFLEEFYKAAKVFKPLSSTMSKRFIISSDKTSYIENEKRYNEAPELYEATKTSSDEQAAKVGMFGSLTRTVTSWTPSAILCRRMNIANPFINKPMQDSHLTSAKIQTKNYNNSFIKSDFNESSGKKSEYNTQSIINHSSNKALNTAEKTKEANNNTYSQHDSKHLLQESNLGNQKTFDTPVNSEKNSSMGESLFTAIFGDSDDDSE